MAIVIAEQHNMIQMSVFQTTHSTDAVDFRPILQPNRADKVVQMPATLQSGLGLCGNVASLHEVLDSL